jgi:hypothetical protein
LDIAVDLYHAIHDESVEDTQRNAHEEPAIEEGIFASYAFDLVIGLTA